ncbi:MAG: restriction endonuclease subunit S [Coprobacillus sp.]|nr:restriction endonuclease subunit S [Coprobacillus sp.]
MEYKLNEILFPYSEKNTEQKYFPVAVGKYGIRKREDIYKKELAKDFSKNKVIRKNTLTIGMGSTQIDIGILDTDDVYSVSPAYHTYKINTNIVIPKYLDWLLKCINPELSKLYMIASARQGKSVDFERMMKHKISIPSLEEQEKINKILSKIYEAKIKFYEVSQKYNDIVKSQFIELINHSTEKNVLSDFVKKCKIEKCKDESLPPLSITKDEGFVLQEEKFNKRIASKDISTYKVIPYGKLVMGLHIDEGAFAVQNIVPLGIVSPAYKVWDIKKELVVPAVLQYALRTDESITYYKSKFKGATVERRNPISENDLMNTPLNLPKMEEQIKFSLICQQIDKSKYFGGVSYA